MKIEDGKGSGILVEVDEKNRLSTVSVIRSTEHEANFIDGQAWSIPIEQTPTAIAACGTGDFFYLKNTGVNTYVIEGFQYRVASAETVTITLNPTGTPGATTCVTPVNLNTGSAKVITGNIYRGASLTGLSGGNSPYKLYLTSTETKNFNFEQDIVIEPGGSILFTVGTGGVLVNLDINIYETKI